MDEEMYMKQRSWLALWAAMFILCSALGFIPEPQGAAAWAMGLASAAFFLPPAVVLYQAGKAGDRQGVKLICFLSALSLGLTLAVLVLNFLAALRPEFWGTVLHYVLVVVSTPMIASGHWALSLFAWACLLMASLGLLRRKG